MIPILCQATDPFTTIGELTDCLSCIVTDKLNELPELTLTYPVDGTRASSISTDKIIKAQPSANSDADYFRVISISRNHNNVMTVKAIHCCYELSFIPTTICTITETSPDTIFSMLMTEIQSRGTDSFYIRSALNNPSTFEDGVDYIGSTAMNVIRDVQNHCGGEIYFKGFAVTLCKNIGSDNGYEIAYGTNMLSFNTDYSNENLYTHLFPYAKYKDASGNVKVLTLSNDIIPINQLNPYVQREGTCFYNKILPVDMSGSFKDGEDFTETVLATKAEAYMQDEKNLQATADVFNVATSYVHLGDTIQYKEEITSNINGVGDIVTVKYSPWGINRKCEVVSSTYDVLTEMYNNIQLSSAKPNMVGVMRTIGDKLSDRQPQNVVWKNYQISKDRGLEFVYQEGEDSGNS